MAGICASGLLIYARDVIAPYFAEVPARASPISFEDSVISAALFRIYFLLFTAYCPLCQRAKEVEKCKCTLAAIHFTKLPQTIFCANNREYNDISQC